MKSIFGCLSRGARTTICAPQGCWWPSLPKTMAAGSPSATLPAVLRNAPAVCRGSRLLRHFEPSGRPRNRFMHRPNRVAAYGGKSPPLTGHIRRVRIFSLRIAPGPSAMRRPQGWRRPARESQRPIWSPGPKGLRRLQYRQSGARPQDMGATAVRRPKRQTAPARDLQRALEIWRDGAK